MLKLKYSYMKQESEKCEYYFNISICVGRSAIYLLEIQLTLPLFDKRSVYFIHIFHIYIALYNLFLTSFDTHRGTFISHSETLFSRLIKDAIVRKVDLKAI